MPSTTLPSMRELIVRYLGLVSYGEALALQKELVQQRKSGQIPDHLLLLEHPHVITLGRNGRREHLLAPVEVLRRAGVEFYHTDRGGDITYHGPGQLVGYPIIALREWKRDVVAYVRALETVLIEALGRFGIQACRKEGLTGVWVGNQKIAAIGVHISRWVSYHGFALNVTTDLSYFHYIVPCGLTLPVTSMEALGCRANLEEVGQQVSEAFARVFSYERMHIVNSMERAR